MRGLAKVMEFMHAISILFIIINIYWSYYQFARKWDIGIGAVDRILLGFRRTAGLFPNIFWTKFFAVLFLALSYLGTKDVRGQKIIWHGIVLYGVSGLLFFFSNEWLLTLPPSFPADTVLYIVILTAGYICLFVVGLWMSYLLKTDLLEDVFSAENESFVQETELKENEYSVNLHTRSWFRGRAYDGWINLVNPFRVTMVLGTLGSGKSCAIISQYIKQTIKKGYSLFLYGFEYPDLSRIVCNHLLAHLDGYKVKPKLCATNFDNPKESHRCNPIRPDFITDISDAYESAYTIVLNLSRMWISE